MNFLGGLRSQRGQAVLAVLAVGIAVNTALYLMFNYFPNLSRQSLRSGAILQYRLALNSMVDYTVYGLRNQWCFSDIWMQESPCDLTHAANSERILLTNDAVEKIMARPSLPKSTPVQIKTITKKVKLDEFTNFHPLYRMAQNLKATFADEDGNVKNALGDEITFTIERIDNTSFPIRGRESFVRVRVSIDVIGGFGFVPDSELYAQTIVGIYPRELSLFSLIVPNDLRLDKRSRSGLSDGDLHFRVFDNRTQANAVPGGSQGLVFMSPVFVNRHLHLPSDENSPYGPDSAQDDYTPVTFADAVYLGSGLVFRDDAPAKPRTAGGLGDQFNEQGGKIGGLKRGIRIDGVRDIGLDYLSGRLSGTSPDRTLADACIRRASAMSELAATKESALVIRRHRPTDYDASTRTRTFYYRLGLSDGNVFRPILNASLRGDLAADKKLQDTEFDASAGTSTAWLEATVEVGSGDGFLLEARYGSNTTMTMHPKFPPPNIPKCGPGNTNIENTVRNVSCPAGMTGNIIELCDGTNFVEFSNTCAPGTPPAVPPTCGPVADALPVGHARNVACGVNHIGTISQVCKAGAPNFYEEIATNCVPLPPPAQITLRTKPTLDPTSNKEQPNMLDLEVSVKEESTIPDDINIKLIAYELGSDTSDGNNRRTNGSTGKNGYDRTGDIDLDRNSVLSRIDEDSAIGSTYIVAEKSNRSHPQHSVIENPPDETIDYAELEEICNGLDGPDGSSFGVADWDFDFAPASRSSWSYTVPEGDVVDRVLNDSNSTPSNLKFHIDSINTNCIVQSSATLVAGFYTCEKLTIESRTNPLRIIGTFIVTKELNIHRDAYIAGITWSNIYHPQAILELRNAGSPNKILGPEAGGLCPSDAPPYTTPIWNPNPDIVNLASVKKCSPVSLRERSDPMRWTTVDPDCGFVGANPHCKQRVRRYLVQEINREVSN